MRVGTVVVGTTDRRTGQSATARAFGASAAVAATGHCLFLVVGRGVPPTSAITASGGQVVTRMVDPAQVLAIVPLGSMAQLQRHPDVALAGPVSIDPDRFARFAALAGLDAATTQ